MKQITLGNPITGLAGASKGSNHARQMCTNKRVGKFSQRNLII